MTSVGTHRHLRRVAFVADELLGYAGNGIGTTTTFVSLALARVGHRVEILFAGPTPTGPVDPEWQRLYESAGIRIRHVPRGAERVEPGPFARMRDVELALCADPPEVVVVQDLGAPAYTALRLRRLGLAFEETSFVVFCHGTRQWITDVSRKVRVLPGAHAVTVLERASVELADAVVSPSTYLVDWMRTQGWRLPERTFVIRHLSRAGATGERSPASAQPVADRVDRLAFFGRLEERKGLRPFLAALNGVDAALLQRVELEFVGRPTPAWPVERVTELLSERTRGALRGVVFETALDQHEALARLSRPGTLAVMPSFEENSPNTVYECLEHEIPFLASDAAGIRELVAPEDHPRVLFPPTETGIAGALGRALTDGEALRPARPSFDDTDSLRRWEEVLSLPSLSLTAGGEPGPADDAEWVLLLEETDVPEPALRETLARAARVSGADVVTCGVVVDGTVHLFAGEPRALGLLGNGYGTAALVRRSFVEGEETKASWPLLSKLSMNGAKIVSVPRPLVTSVAAPATLLTHPDEAERVLEHVEQELPRSLRSVAALAVGLAKAESQPSSPDHAARRALRRLVRGLRR
jgi:glycosyltransferase involved in cell wall biosynthesis